VSAEAEEVIKRLRVHIGATDEDLRFQQKKVKLMEQLSAKGALELLEEVVERHKKLVRVKLALEQDVEVRKERLAALRGEDRRVATERFKRQSKEAEQSAAKMGYRLGEMGEEQEIVGQQMIELFERVDRVTQYIFEGSSYRSLLNWANEKGGTRVDAAARPGDAEKADQAARKASKRTTVVFTSTGGAGGGGHRASTSLKARHRRTSSMLEALAAGAGTDPIQQLRSTHTGVTTMGGAGGGGGGGEDDEDDDEDEDDFDGFDDAGADDGDRRPSGGRAELHSLATPPKDLGGLSRRSMVSHASLFDKPPPAGAASLSFAGQNPRHLPPAAGGNVAALEAKAALVEGYRLSNGVDGKVPHESDRSVERMMKGAMRRMSTQTSGARAETAGVGGLGNKRYTIMPMRMAHQLGSGGVNQKRTPAALRAARKSLMQSASGGL